MNESQPQRKPSTAWGIGIVMLIVGFFAGLLAAPRPATSAANTNNTPSSSSPDILGKAPIVLNLEQNGQKSQIVGNPMLADASSGATYILGDSNAKVTMIEFGDYRCGYCHLFTNQTLPRIIESYVKTGKVRYIYRDTISVGGEQTMTVASVAACANEQGKFWDFHAMAHNNVDAWANFTGTELISTLSKMSNQIGINQSTLSTCVSSNHNATRYNTEVELSKRFGVTGTPSFIINGYFFSGALPFEVYQKIFETFGVV